MEPQANGLPQRPVNLVEVVSGTMICAPFVPMDFGRKCVLSSVTLTVQLAAASATPLAAKCTGGGGPRSITLVATSPVDVVVAARSTQTTLMRSPDVILDSAIALPWPLAYLVDDPSVTVSVGLVPSELGSKATAAAPTE